MARTVPPLLLRTGLLAVCIGLPAAAADAPKTAPPPAPGVYEPPVLTFPGDRITLLEAVRLTLANDPNLMLAAQQTIGAQGAAQAASGQFDNLLLGDASFSRTLTALTSPQPGAPTDTDTKTADLNLTFDMPFREGFTIGAFGDADWFRTRLTGGDGSFPQAADLYTYTVGFTLDAALLRGRGRDATGAAETASRIDWEASGLTLKHAASASVLNTALAYWNLVGAQEQLQVAKGTLDLSTKQVEMTKALIAGDEIPRAEISRVLASQATDQGQVALAERGVAEARVALARAMGVSVLVPANAPLAADDFPALPDRSTLAGLTPSDLIATAVDRRFDRKAALKLKESGGVLLVAAKTELRPRLDFHGQISGAAVGESTFSETSGVTLPTYDLRLSFEKPFGNNAAKGLVLQQQAALGQQTIGAADLERVIKANVVQILRSLQETADQVERAKEATGYYQKTIGDENEMFRNGQSTLIDTITTRQLGTTAYSTYAFAKQTWATLVTQLRFETGTLVSEAGGQNVVTQDSLVTIPTSAAAR